MNKETINLLAKKAGLIAFKGRHNYIFIKAEAITCVFPTNDYCNIYYGEGSNYSQAYEDYEEILKKLANYYGKSLTNFNEQHKLMTKLIKKRAGDALEQEK